MPASPDTSGDTGPACAGDTIAACGASCTACTAPSEREDPTCDGTSCGTACTDAAPRCTDGSCSRVVWSFTSGSVDGIAAVAPAGLAVAVRSFNGEQALAIDVASIPPEIRITVPVCLSGVIDVHALTLSYRVFFQGGTLQNENYYTQASVPSPQPSGFLARAACRRGCG